MSQMKTGLSVRLAAGLSTSTARDKLNHKDSTCSGKFTRFLVIINEFFIVLV